MDIDTIKLPVPVQQLPHWRVLFRPDEYNPNRIESLSSGVKLIQLTQLSLRGWNYPHLSGSQELEFGQSWIASWANFMGHVEYWRLYQSGQFLHLFGIREATELRWRAQLEAATKSHLSYLDTIDWSSISGYLDIINTLYTVTEIFEFATRLCQKGLYDRTVNISIGLKHAEGFVLTADNSRTWHSYYQNRNETIEWAKDVSVHELVSNSAEHSMRALTWFFERFGWLEPPLSVLKKEQDAFLSGRR